MGILSSQRERIMIAFIIAEQQNTSNVFLHVTLS